MTANVNVTKLLFKRGNTAQNAAYTGINGEITVDTQAKTLRIHDGVTAGGNVITAGGVVGSYSNTNAAAYIPTDPTITSIQANVAAANAAISAIAGIDTNLIANAATQQTQINLINANVAAANALIPNLLAVSGNIIPSANVTYSLGNEQFQWRDLWVSNNTIYIGNTPIRVDGGTLLVNNAPVSGGSNIGNLQIDNNTNQLSFGPGESYSFLYMKNDGSETRLANDNGNVQISTIKQGPGGGTYYWTFDDTGNILLPNNSSSINYANGVSILSGLGGAVYGNIVVGNSEINFVASSSGDGFGFSTIELRPDTNAFDDSYLIIDPTYPSHIHIRAGGAQDNSLTELYLGGENSHFKVNNGLNPDVSIASNNYVWLFDTTGNITIPTEIIFGSSPAASSTGIIFGDGSFQNKAFTGPGDKLSNQGYDVTLDSFGTLTVPGNILFPGGSTYSNNTFVSPTSNGVLNTYEWKFSDQAIGNDTITLQWNLLDTTLNQWYLSTNSQTKYFVLDGESQSLGFNGGSGDSGTVTFGATTNNGAGGTNDIELTSVTGNAYIRTGSNSWKFNQSGNLTFPDSTVQTTAWTGTVNFGNAIAIGYNTGTVSQGSKAVAVGSTAGNVSQGTGAVAVGDRSGATSQGNLTVAVGSQAGEISQGLQATAVGSGAGNYNQGAGTVAIGTNAGAFNQGLRATAIGSLAGASDQGEYAVAIGNFAGGNNQGNNSIIINATGSALEQTTDNTFTVKPIRNASGSNVLYYDASTGEITYDTASGGTYGNTEVAAYLPTYTGNVGAARVQVTNAVDFMYGGFPYMGWQLSGSDTLKLRTNIASGDYTNDAVIVDRQSLAVNVVATLSAGNIITTSGVFWSNGTAYSTGSGTYGNTEVAAYLPTYTGNIGAGNVNVTNTVYAANIVTSGTSGNISGVNVISANTFVFAANGVNILSAAGGGTYGNTEVAAYLLTWPNIDSNILDATSANITTLRAANFNSANAVISGGYISALTNASITTATITTLNSTGGNVTTLRATNFGTANAVITGGYINSLANLSATTAVFTNLSTGNAVISGGYISALTNASITTSVVTNFSTANAVITGGYASGLANVTATGNVTAGNLIGYGSNTNIVAGAYTSTFDNVGNVILPNAYVSGNTTVMGIAPGYAPNRPAFRVYGSGVNTTQTTGNVNLRNEVLTVDYNQGNYYNNTTGVFTAPVAGLYNTTLVARVANNNGLNQVAVLRNGNNIGANVVCFWETDTNAGVATHFGTSGTILLNAGEFLSANILAGNISFDGNDSWTVTYLG